MFFGIFIFGSLWIYSEMCPIEYSATDSSHSFCSHPYSNVVDQRVNFSERIRILHLHNHERRLVHGLNMQKMYWNDDLAEIALRYARTCIFEHDTSSQRNVPKIPLFTGQNLAMGYENWTQAIGGWIEEKEHYIYGYPATGIVGHYTQMIWHSTALVGCAATLCPPYGPYTMSWPFYVCNYVTGQLNTNFHRPYEQGSSDQSLHDCKGKVCLYNGTLDLNTCECHCSTYASGSQCEKLDCSNLPTCYYQSKSSCIAVNVPSECPRLCGLCDRYDVLKHVYGEDNLSPMNLIPKTITTRTTAAAKPIGRKLKKKLHISPRICSTTTTSKSLSPSLSLCLYLTHLFIVIFN